MKICPPKAGGLVQKNELSEFFAECRAIALPWCGAEPRIPYRSQYLYLPGRRRH